jgi:hypothetical protein
MKKGLFTLIAIIALSTITIEAKAASIVAMVDGMSGPWIQALNPGYFYGELLSAPNFNLPPTIVNTSSGLSMQVGNILTIEYLLGQANAGGGGLWNDANGVPGWLCTGPLTPYNFTDHSSIANLEELMGVFADSNGAIVGLPFLIGNGPVNVIIPLGANQLQLGFNDGWYNDNGGAILVQVTETPTPEPSSMILGLMGIGGLLKLRRKYN